MSQSDNLELLDAALNEDVDFKTPLKRVSYQPGMLLGLEATNAEQAYHRRHLNRHNYWLHGSGTVAGLRVSVDRSKYPDDSPEDDDEIVTDENKSVRLHLHVTPGIGIDGLGREISVHEPYCIDIGAWLTTQYQDKENNRWAALISDGYDQPNNLLWLKVTMRYQDTPSGLQPVMAEAVNAGTDPVKPSRIQDSVLFELIAERPQDSGQSDHPFAAHNAVPAWNDALSDKLSTDEKKRIAGASDEQKARLQLKARLLYALANDNAALAMRGTGSFADVELGRRLARTMLAYVAIRLTDDQKLIVNPLRISVDNLARPFVLSAATLAQLI